MGRSRFDSSKKKKSGASSLLNAARLIAYLTRLLSTAAILVDYPLLSVIRTLLGTIMSYMMWTRAAKVDEPAASPNDTSKEADTKEGYRMLHWVFKVTNLSTPVPLGR